MAADEALHAKVDALSEQLARLTNFLGFGRTLEDADRAEFPDIEPNKLYEVSDLVKLRGGTVQSLYKAISAKRLKDTPSAGRKQIRGRDFIAWLRLKGA